MSNKLGGLVIHPIVAKYVDFKTIQVMLDVRDDLRAGRIENFDMNDILHPCGTPSCMAGHIGVRLGDAWHSGISWYRQVTYYSGPLGREFWELFAAYNPSDPRLAADAIDHFLTTAKGRWPSDPRNKEKP